MKIWRLGMVPFLAIVASLLLGASRPVSAACTNPLPTAKGTAAFTIHVPADGTYRLWTHMLAPTTASNAVYLRVDDAHCQLTVGNSSSIAANKFSWIDYQSGNTKSKINLSLSAGSHTFTYAGLHEGVGIDKMILVVDGACSPTGDGSNCTATIAAPLNSNTTQPHTSGQNPNTNTDTNQDTTGAGNAQTPHTGVGNQTEQAPGTVTSSFKNPLIFLPLAGISLAVSTIAALWTFRPDTLRGLSMRARGLFHRQPVVANDIPTNTVVVVQDYQAPSTKGWGLVGAIGFGIIGLGCIVVAFAASASIAFMLTNATVANGASVVNNSGAIGGKMIQFASQTASTPNQPAPTQPDPTPPSTPTCAAGTIGTYPNCFTAPPAAAAPGKSWKISFSEEFNGSSLDTTKLTPCFDWNFGGCTETFNNGRERYMPSQVVVNNGTAKLIAAPLSPPYASGACQNSQCTYKAGLLSTARPRADNGSDYLYKFTYGYVESRIKFPATRGFFTAFWMLPTNISFNYRSEIDILELLGDDPTTMFMTYHYNNRGQSYTPNTGKFNNGACAVKDYSKDFVRMGVDWQPTYIAWYIDGVKCGQFNGNASTIENGPMQIILHMMVDNNWQRSWNVGLQDPALTRQLEVDYIRVYQQQ